MRRVKDFLAGVGLPVAFVLAAAFGIGAMSHWLLSCTVPLVAPGQHPTTLQATVDSVREVVFVAYPDEPEKVEAIWDALDLLEGALSPDGTVPPDAATAFLNATDDLIMADWLDPGVRTVLSRIRAAVRILAASY